MLDGVENDVPDDDDHTVLDGGDHHDVFGGVDNASMQVDLSMRAIAAGQIVFSKMYAFQCIYRISKLYIATQRLILL